MNKHLTAQKRTSCWILPPLCWPSELNSDDMKVWIWSKMHELVIMNCMMSINIIVIDSLTAAKPAFSIIASSFSLWRADGRDELLTWSMTELWAGNQPQWAFPPQQRLLWTDLCGCCTNMFGIQPKIFSGAGIQYPKITASLCNKRNGLQKEQVAPWKL